MRSEKEMLDLIIGVAKADDRIRAVYLEGSRANPEAPRDDYMDYDITYAVHDVTPFYNTPKFMDKFGEVLIMQMPEAMLGAGGDGHFTYLTVFSDGIRIDLSFYSIASELETFASKLVEREPYVMLLNKDNVLPAFPPATGEAYWVKPPDETAFYSACNEFWWCLNNVAKGIARDELPYAMYMYHSIVRPCLENVLEWYIGIMNGFTVSAGKMGKYFKRYLPPEMYEAYAKTYSDHNYADFWKSVFIACDLFHTAAAFVARHMGFTYRQHEEDGMRRYLRMVQVRQYYNE